jgi:hypothetical protein
MLDALTKGGGAMTEPKMVSLDVVARLFGNVAVNLKRMQVPASITSQPLVCGRSTANC